MLTMRSCWKMKAFPGSEIQILLMLMSRLLLFETFFFHPGSSDFLGYFYLPSLPETSLKAKNWKCKTCGKLFSQRASLARHDREIHQNALSHECEQCEAKFTRREHLLRHVARIHPVL